jgi:hypothetical protein
MNGANGMAVNSSKKNERVLVPITRLIGIDKIMKPLIARSRFGSFN